MMVLPDDAAPLPGGMREMILRGRVLRGTETVDAFRYRFDSLPSVTTSRPLAFERRLRPGRYRIELEMEAPASGRVYKVERELAVPEVAASLPVPPGPAPLAIATASVAPAAAHRATPELMPEARRLFTEADADSPHPIPVCVSPHPPAVSSPGPSASRPGWRALLERGERRRRARSSASPSPSTASPC